MTMFPNCREKYTKDAYPHGGTIFRRAEDIPEDEINAYWEGNVDKKYIPVLRGYDDAVDEVDHFFSNISDVIYERFGEYEGNKVDDAIMCEDRPISDYDDGEISKMSKQTYILKLLHTEVAARLESYRNMMITSMIDSQGE